MKGKAEAQDLRGKPLAALHITTLTPIVNLLICQSSLTFGFFSAFVETKLLGLVNLASVAFLLLCLSWDITIFPCMVSCAQL